MNKKKKVIAFITFIILLATGFFIMKPKTEKSKEVATNILDKKVLNQLVTVTGNVEGKEKYEIILNSSQKVSEVYHKEGDEVKNGTILLKLDTAELESQLRKAEASMDMAKINLNKLLGFNERSEVKSAENSVKQAELAIEDANRAYEDAKNKFSSNETLYKGGYLSKYEYDNSQKLVEDLNNKVKSAEVTLLNAKNSLADVHMNKSEEIALQKKQIESYAADIESFKRKIEDSNIKTTVDGKVVKLSAKKGQYPTSENSLVQVYDLSSYRVKIQVNQKDVVLMAVGQKAVVKPKGLNKKYSGVVTSISNKADITQNGTNKESKVEVEVIIDKPDSDIKVGYEADVDICLKEKSDALSVNFEAIKTEKDGKKYLFVVENNKAKKIYVKTGVETALETEILEGIKKGEKYISNPSEDLKEGDFVEITK